MQIDPKEAVIFHIENLERLELLFRFCTNKTYVGPMRSAFRITSTELHPDTDLHFYGEAGDILLPLGFTSDSSVVLEEMESEGYFFNVCQVGGVNKELSDDMISNMELVPVSDLRAGKGWGVFSNQPDQNNFAQLRDDAQKNMDFAMKIFNENGALPMMFMFQPEWRDEPFSIIASAQNDETRHKACLKISQMLAHSNADRYTVLMQAMEYKKGDDGEFHKTEQSHVLSLVSAHINGEKISLSLPILDDTPGRTVFGQPSISETFCQGMQGRLGALFDWMPTGDALSKMQNKLGKELMDRMTPSTEEVPGEIKEQKNSAQIVPFKKKKD